MDYVIDENEEALKELTQGAKADTSMGKITKGGLLAAHVIVHTRPYTGFYSS